MLADTSIQLVQVRVELSRSTVNPEPVAPPVRVLTVTRADADVRFASVSIADSIVDSVVGPIIDTSSRLPIDENVVVELSNCDVEEADSDIALPCSHSCVVVALAFCAKFVV